MFSLAPGHLSPVLLDHRGFLELTDGGFRCRVPSRGSPSRYHLGFHSAGTLWNSPLLSCRCSTPVVTACLALVVDSSTEFLSGIPLLDPELGFRVSTLLWDFWCVVLAGIPLADTAGCCSLAGAARTQLLLSGSTDRPSSGHL